MSLIDLIRGERQSLDEKSSRYPSGRGSYKRKTVTSSRKSKVPIYDTIKAALKKTSPGTIFSTKGSYRMYVTTSGGWGKSKQQRVSGRTAKGFTPGSATPSADWKSVKSHAARTRVKHAGATAGRLKAKARREKDKPKLYKAKRSK
jgi:hypothetical protein